MVFDLLFKVLNWRTNCTKYQLVPGGFDWLRQELSDSVLTTEELSLAPDLQC